ncbi:MAG: type I-E CRISPR-associated protein Cse2/CasB [Solobacterium sp.]|jgi:hypothetical protein|nr:type I-E CRISPR-associated protein Cse2/CasB [Solobacterium sp.]
MSDEIRKSLFDLTGINEKSKILFRRSAGKMLNDCPSAMAAFYSMLPSGIAERDENRYFFVLCLACKQEEKNHTLPAEQILRLARADNNSRDSIDHRIDSLMTTDWNDQNGLLALKMMRLLQVAEKNIPDVNPDYDKLFNDLKKWNYQGHSVQRSWARTIYCNSEKEEGK